MKIHFTGITIVAVLAIMSTAPTAATAAALRGGPPAGAAARSSRKLLSIFGLEPITEACSSSHVKEMVDTSQVVHDLRGLSAKLKQMQQNADSQSEVGPTWGYKEGGQSITDPFAAVASCVGGSNPGAACTPVAACAGVVSCKAKAEKHCKGGGTCVLKARMQGLLGKAPKAPKEVCHSLQSQHVPHAWCNGNAHTSCATMVAAYPDHCAFGAAPATGAAVADAVNAAVAAEEAATALRRQLAQTATIPQYGADCSSSCSTSAFLHACRMECDADHQCNAFIYHAMNPETHVASCSFYRTTMSKATAHYLAFNEFETLQAIANALEQTGEQTPPLQEPAITVGDNVYSKIGVPQVALSAALSEVQPKVQALLKQQQAKYHANPCEHDISELESLAKDIEAAIKWMYQHMACPLIKKGVGYVVKTAEKEGKAEISEVCTELATELGAACEIVGLGPEDPLADVCAGLLVTAAESTCNKYLNKEMDKLGSEFSNDLISGAGC